jgi:hypothetical protein
MPTLLEDVTQLLVRDLAYHCPRTAWIDPAHPTQPLTARLLRNTPARGRVLFPDGSPAAGITVRAEGRGRTNHYYRREVRSGPDGTFEFLLYPDQSYLLAVVDDTWAARSLSGVLVREGQPLTRLDLQLIRGTRLCGRVTLGPERQPAAAQTITLIERGSELGEDLKCSFYQEEVLVRWAETDEAGRYELRLGPGPYHLKGPPPGAREELVVGEEEEVVRDFHLPHLARGLVSGEVRRAGGEGRSVANAVVLAYSVVPGHAWLETVADGEGRFSGERWRDRMLVYARDPEGAEAGCTEIAEQDEAVTVEVRPAATARGKVVDREGAPLSNENVFCRMKLALRDGSPVAFQIEVRTDLEGAFAVPGLLVGSSCDVRVLHGYEPVGPRFEFEVSEAGSVDLPDLVLQGPGEV